MRRSVCAIDPGTTESAYVLLSGDGIPARAEKVANADLLRSMPRLAMCADVMAIEMVASYGMPVGKSVFETVRWIGNFEREWFHCTADRANTPLEHSRRATLVLRRDVKMHLVGKLTKVNDAVLRQNLIDRYGPTKADAVGTKKKPGPLYGFKKDIWQAGAVAVTVYDMFNDTPAGVTRRVAE